MNFISNSRLKEIIILWFEEIQDTHDEMINELLDNFQGQMYDDEYNLTDELIEYIITIRQNDINELSSIFKLNNVVLYRKISLDNIKSIDDLLANGVGNYWTTNKSNVGVYWNEYQEDTSSEEMQSMGKNILLISAEFNTNNIDFEASLLERLYGYGEKDIVLYPGSQGKIKDSWLNNNKIDVSAVLVIA